MYAFFLYILFFFLPLVHTKFFDTVFIDTSFFVNGNYEFTKVVFFNICSTFILGLFLGESVIKEQKIFLPRKVFFVLCISLFIIVTSTLFSLSPYTSLFGNGDKSHSLIVFANLLGLIIVLYNSSQKTITTLVSVIVSSLLCVSLLSIKEYFYPTFDYGNLSSRAIGTFGHPNYLALFLLLTIPYIVEKKKYLFLLFPLSITLLLTKSLLGITLGIAIGIYYLLKFFPIKNRFQGIFLAISSLALLSIGIYSFVPIEKVHSFFSRFYLWETTLRIIFSDWRILFFGGGAETLSILFDSFKSPYLYIYENFGFTADRPHNFFLNIWYHFGILGGGILIYSLYKFLSHIRKNPLDTYEISIIIFLGFCTFNYPSIAIYLLIIFSISVLLKTYAKKHVQYLPASFILIIFICISTYGAIKSSNLYRAELSAYSKDYLSANEIFPTARYYYKLGDFEKGYLFDPLPSDQYYTSQIQNFSQIENNCFSLTHNFSSIENFFYCGRVLERIKKQDQALQYYRQGVTKLPDLWNPNSHYWEDAIIKNTITGNRFFSKKFGNIPAVLEKLEIPQK